MEDNLISLKADQVLPIQDIISSEVADKCLEYLKSNPYGWVFLMTELLARSTPSHLISYHEGPRKTTLAYVSGSYAKATRAALTRLGITSDFEIVQTEIDKDESLEASCLGRLTFKYRCNGVLDTVTSMQWGGCIRRPGMTWGSARKGAATDCEKKCLNEFGWAMDVYSTEAEWNPPQDKEDLKKLSLDTLYNMGSRAGMTKEQTDDFVLEKTAGKKAVDLEVRDLAAVKRKLAHLGKVDES